MNTGASTAMGHHGPGTGKRFAEPGCLCAAPFPHPGKSIAAQSRRHAYKQGNNFPVISVLSISAEGMSEG